MVNNSKQYKPRIQNCDDNGRCECIPICPDTHQKDPEEVTLLIDECCTSGPRHFCSKRREYQAQKAGEAA